jgi:thiol:disulfide interchange protein DsbA
MKKIISILFMVMLPLMVSASDYQENKQYTKVSDKASKKPEVREFFSYYCPHCLRFEPFFEKVKKTLPVGVTFERNHVDFLQFTTKEIQFMLTKALVVAQQLGREDELSSSIFDYLQVQRGTVSSEKDIRNIFVIQGVDGDKFDKLMSSFTVVSKAKSMRKTQDYFSNKRALTGVPAVIVNGKYRINNQALDKKNFEEDYSKLIKHLLTLS